MNRIRFVMCGCGGCNLPALMGLFQRGFKTAARPKKCGGWIAAGLLIYLLQTCPLRAEAILGNPVGQGVTVEEGISQPLEEGVLLPERPSPAAPVLDGATLCQALEEVLLQHYRLSGAVLKLSLLRPWKPLALAPDGVWKLELLEAPSAGIASACIVRVAIGVGKERTQWSLPLQCALWKEALVVTHYIRPGSPLGLEDFSLQPVDILRQRAPVVFPEEWPLDYQAAKPLTPGRLLLWTDMGRRPLIRKGEAVEVLAERGPLSIQLKAHALEPGCLGQIITLKNGFSNRNFKAKVVAEKRASVDF